jgi:hypothetical protein
MAHDGDQQLSIGDRYLVYQGPSSYAQVALVKARLDSRREAQFLIVGGFDPSILHNLDETGNARAQHLRVVLAPVVHSIHCRHDEIIIGVTASKLLSSNSFLFPLDIEDASESHPEPVGAVYAPGMGDTLTSLIGLAISRLNRCHRSD